MDLDRRGINDLIRHLRMSAAQDFSKRFDGDQVLAWRAQQLFDAGYNEFQAEALAAGQCDLHEAVRLLKDGCPADIAFDIEADVDVSPHP